jgi:hypothetical protein
MRKVLVLADRTAVLFLGIAAGAAIGYAFGSSGERPAEHVARPVIPIAPAAKTAAPTAGKPAQPVAGPESALPFPQHLLDTVKAGKPVRVGVFGDSFGDGVWSALYRLLPASEQYRVVKYSQQSTGFTRYASLNLEEHAKQQLAADGPIDVAVISFGANDTQGVYAGGGHAAALMTPEWQRVIGARVDSFVALMRARGAMVYWVGLPKMRAAAFDSDIAAMNDFYTARMKALSVPFIDVRPMTVDAAGNFAPYLPDPVSHERRLLRANDGVHMSMNGYVVITRGLASRIKAYVAAARQAAGVPAVIVPPKPAPAKPAAAKPALVKPAPAKPRAEPPAKRIAAAPATPRVESKPKPAPRSREAEHAKPIEAAKRASAESGPSEALRRIGEDLSTSAAAKRHDGADRSGADAPVVKPKRREAPSSRPTDGDGQ